MWRCGICAQKAAGLPLHKYIGSFRSRLPVYASGNFHSTVQEYVDEALYYKEKGILDKAHPRRAVGIRHGSPRGAAEGGRPRLPPDERPVGQYTLGDAVGWRGSWNGWVTSGLRNLSGILSSTNTQICAGPWTFPSPPRRPQGGCHWGVAQSIAQRARRHRARGRELEERRHRHPENRPHGGRLPGSTCEVHTTTMNYMDLANVHVSCAIRNCKYFEYFVPEDRYRLPMKGIFRSGRLHIRSDKPGIGAELD